jgi:metal-dependent amidase/aminoacylase/carboxypeptidase family protein
MPAADTVESRLFDSRQTLHAPHLVDVEVAHVVRRYAATGQIDRERGRAAHQDLPHEQSGMNGPQADLWKVPADGGTPEKLLRFREETGGEAGYGSTDCGNVSQALPTIHPYIRISPDGIPGHSREFAEWAKSPLARAGMVAGAKALALTALDLVAKPEQLQRAKEEFAKTRG